MKVVVLRTLLIVSVVLLALPGHAAASCTDGAGDLSQEDVQNIVDAYNQNADQIPGFIAGQISGERVELKITGANAFTYTVVFDNNARAQSVTEGSNDPTLRVTANSATLCEAAQSDNPAAALGDAYQNGDIDIEGVGTANSVKVTVMKTAVSIAKFFGFF